MRDSGDRRSFLARAREIGALIAGRRSPSTQTPGGGPSPASPREFLQRATHALDALPSDRAPILVAYEPLVRNNPYQAMLYSGCWERGIATMPVAGEPEPAVVRTLTSRADVWLHVHWTGPVLSAARGKDDAHRRLDAFTSKLDGLAAAGGRIAWTVHNVLPHERRFPDLEVAVCRALAERADLIHVLHEKTPALTQPSYDLPREKIRVVPHSSYLGIYPDVIGRVQARHDLGVPRDALTFTFLGGVRPYKGIERLIDAFSAVAKGRDDLRLLLAGPGFERSEVRAVRARALGVPGITARLERIPEWDIQRYMNAADVAVLPYSDVLSSGALMLAFTFGRPVIASRRGLLTDLVSEDVGLLFDPEDPAGLEAALRAGRSLTDPRFAHEARRRASAYPPRAMADDFAELIRTWPRD